MSTVLDAVSIPVNRAKRPRYGRSVREVMHPEFERSGPDVITLDASLLWLHEKQTRGSVTGDVIYQCLKDEGTLERCFNLQDGLAIQAQGARVFNAFFKGKELFLWKSVARHLDGQLHVPSVYELADEVRIQWSQFRLYWYENHPAPQHPR